MSKYTLYHNPRWGKSRGAVSLLNENKINCTVVEYLKNKNVVNLVKFN